jgi:MFS family permease
MRLPPSLQVVRDRNFSRYVAAVSVSALGNSMATVALAFAALDLGGVRELGIVLLVREIPLVVFLLLGGVWADRIPRRLILVACDVFRGAAQAATAALFLAGHAELWNVAALQMVFGVAGAFSRPASTGLVQEAVEAALLQPANALLSLSRSALSVAGPAIGALIVTAASPAWALAADAATFLASALLVGSMQLSRVERPRKTVMTELREGWGEFRSRSWVVYMVVSFGLFQMTFFPALLVLGPAVADAELGRASRRSLTIRSSLIGISSVGASAAACANQRSPSSSAVLAARFAQDEVEEVVKLGFG